MIDSPTCKQLLHKTLFRWDAQATPSAPRTGQHLAPFIGLTEVYPLELQILHKTPSGGTLGVAVLFKNGKSNDFLKALVEAVPPAAI